MELQIEARESMPVEGRLCLPESVYLQAYLTLTDRSSQCSECELRLLRKQTLLLQINTPRGPYSPNHGVGVGERPINN